MSRERQSRFTRHRGRVGLQPPERGWGIHCNHLQHTPGQLQVVPDHHEPWWHHGVLHFQYGRQLAGTAEITRILQVKPLTVTERVISFKKTIWFVCCFLTIPQNPFILVLHVAEKYDLLWQYVCSSTPTMSIYHDRIDLSEFRKKEFSSLTCTLNLNLNVFI